MYLDGALKANNPVYQVMMEADELWDDPAAVMVSIGTGEKTPAPIQGNIMKLARTLTKTLINPGDTDKHFRRDHKFMADNDLIYRFNVPRLGHVKLEDYRSIPAVIRDTRSHFNNTPMAETVKTCSDKIKYTLATEFCNPAFVKSRKASDLSPEEKGKLNALNSVSPKANVTKTASNCFTWQAETMTATSSTLKAPFQVHASGS